MVPQLPSRPDPRGASRTFLELRARRCGQGRFHTRECRFGWIGNADEKEILEDLIVAAMNDARGKAERAAEARMSEMTKGLPLPPGLKLF